MMKQGKAIITVNNPCHEDWDSMSATDRGRYCAACQKTVTDFSLMTDGQILDILKKDKAQSSCGRFAAEQLDRELIDTRYKQSFISRVYTRAAAMLLLCQSVTVSALAQVKKPAMHTQQATKNNNSKKIFQIRGKVIDNETHEPISGIRLQIYGTTTDTLTGKDGSFKIVLSEMPGDTLLLFKFIRHPGNDTAIIEPRKISPAEISSGKEIVIYSYRAERLKEVRNIAYKKPLVMGRYPNRVEYTAEEIKRPPRLTWWQRATKPFRRNKHTAQ